MGVDKASLLAFLTARAVHSNPVVLAVYTGLVERVRRGDFDEKEEDN